MIEDFKEHADKEQKELDESMKESFRQRDERLEKEKGYLTKQLLEEIKAYRNDMVARNYPFQQISDIITKWENKLIEEIKEDK